MLSKEEHRNRAKRIGHVFAPVSVQRIEPLLPPLLMKLLFALEKRIGEPVDVIHWFRMLALDVIGKIPVLIFCLITRSCVDEYNVKGKCF